MASEWTTVVRKGKKIADCGHTTDKFDPHPECVSCRCSRGQFCSVNHPCTVCGAWLETDPRWSRTKKLQAKYRKSQVPAEGASSSTQVEPVMVSQVDVLLGDQQPPEEQKTPPFSKSDLGQAAQNDGQPRGQEVVDDDQHHGQDDGQNDGQDDGQNDGQEDQQGQDQPDQQQDHDDGQEDGQDDDGQEDGQEDEQGDDQSDDQDKDLTAMEVDGQEGDQAEQVPQATLPEETDFEKSQRQWHQKEVEQVLKKHGWVKDPPSKSGTLPETIAKTSETSKTHPLPQLLRKRKLTTAVGDREREKAVM